MLSIKKHFLCLFLLLSSPIRAESSEFVYITQNVRDILTSLYEVLPNHTWSSEFKDVCNRICNDESITEHSKAEMVVLESLALFKNKNCPELAEIEQELSGYLTQLRNNDAQVAVTDQERITRACGSCNNDCSTNCNSKCIKYKKTKAFCNLLAHDVQVDGSGYVANLTAGNLRVTGTTNFTGQVTFDVAPTFPQEPVAMVTTTTTSAQAGSARIARVFFNVDQLANDVPTNYEINSSAITTDSFILFGAIYANVDNSNLFMSGVTTGPGFVAFNLTNSGPDNLTNGFYITYWVLN